MVKFEGFGVAYRAPRAGAMLTLRAVGLVTWQCASNSTFALRD
ncbi:MAG: hypothetical protein ABIQ16_16075 [Polyangiaceae bacterium]